MSRSRMTMSSGPKEADRASRSGPSASSARRRAPAASSVSTSAGIDASSRATAETPARADLRLERPEQDDIDDDPDDEDHDHHREERRGIGQFTGELQPGPDRWLTGNDDEQLAGHQASPGKRPALLEPTHEA